MPYIDVKLYEGRLAGDAAGRLIERLTEAVVEVYGEAVRDQTWIVLQEIPRAHWGIGGKPGSPPTQG